MKVIPRSEEEIDAMGVLPNGTYDFEVKDSTEKVSSGGNEMIELVLTVFDNDGGGHIVFDWLVSSEAGLCIRKCRHFSASVGLLDSYEAGTLDADALVGLSGKVELSVEKDSQYGTRNRVSDYCVPGDYVSRSESKKQNPADTVNLNPHRDNKGEVPF